ncbi:phenylalanine--tRNA ligase subunit beta [bacterium]|nr:phenylalanine--tRNA ligase subunit beta [bacterium]
MKFPLSWISEFVSLTHSPEDLAKKLTMAGLEVEDIIETGRNLSHIITVKIERIDPHPNADKLVITSLFDGKKLHQVVTGATNITVGDVVPVSLPGAVLASGLKIKPSKLRGVDSFGMLCSEEECGISESADGIWILPEDTPLGVDFIQHAQLSDTILDIAILPNRGDCQSILGLAREIASLTGEAFTLPEIDLRDQAIAHSYSVTSTTSLCPLYIGRFINQLNPQPTPLWMKRRLELAGLRSISLYVDITNYVLLETGQPLHAFDDARCKDTDFRISESSRSQDIHTLDGQTRRITKGQVLIHAGKTPVAVAGVMGAANTEVSDDTKAIFLEAAYFNPTSVRRSASALGCRTDSAIRFEKGVSIEGVEYASKRAASLYQELAGASVSNLVVQAKEQKHDVFDNREIVFDAKQLNAFLGTSLKQSEMKDILTSLGFEISKNNMVTVPAWRRHDIHEWPCLAEEIIRVHGFDAIPITLRSQHPSHDVADPLLTMSEKTQDFCVSNGFREVNTYPMISVTEINALNLGKIADWNELANPISPQLAIMRPSLLPSLLQLIKHHHLRQLTDVSVFEVGLRFEEKQEITCLSLAISGHSFTHLTNDAERTISKASLASLKHVITRLSSFLGLGDLAFKLATPPSWAHPKQYQEICFGKKRVGVVTQVHPSALDHYDITEPVFYVELSLSALAANPTPPFTYTPFSRFPFIRRDIALSVPKTTSYEDVLAVIKQYKHKSVQDVGVFDVFESEQLGSDKRSIGIYLLYQDLNKSLEDEQVNKAHERLCQRLISELPVHIR